MGDKTVCVLYTCPVAATVSVFVAPQTEQVKVFVPATVQVAFLVSTPAFHEWVESLVMELVFVAEQTVQVKVLTPSSLQVAALVTTPLL